MFEKLRFFLVGFLYLIIFILKFLSFGIFRMASIWFLKKLINKFLCVFFHLLSLNNILRLSIWLLLLFLILNNLILIGFNYIIILKLKLFFLLWFLINSGFFIHLLLLLNLKILMLFLLRFIIILYFLFLSLLNFTMLLTLINVKLLSQILKHFVVCFLLDLIWLLI